MTVDLKTSVTAPALILAPLTAQAHHRSGHDGGSDRASEMHAGGQRGGDGLRGGRSAEGDRNRPCAWGLADRAMPCVPPGQAARNVTTSDWIGAPETNLAEGTVLSSDDVEPLQVADRLPVLEEGELYALVGDAVLVVRPDDPAAPTSYTVISTYGRAAFPGNWDR